MSVYYGIRGAYSSQPVTMNPLPNPPIIDAIVYMEDHYKLQPSLEETAHHAGFCRSFFTLVSQANGMTYFTYLTNIQIRHVQILLTNTTMSITEIAHETGYCHGDYLSAQFKKRVGMTPREYRKQHSSPYSSFLTSPCSECLNTSTLAPPDSTARKSFYLLNYFSKALCSCSILLRCC